MKKVVNRALCITLMACLSVAVQAQLHFGVKGGVNVSTVHLNSVKENINDKTGFHIGPVLELMVPVAGIGLETAVLYAQKGEGYIDVPVHFKWKFGLPVAKLYVTTGPYASFLVSDKKVWDIPKNIGGTVEAKGFAAGWDFGVGVEVFKHLQAGFNYGLGLTDNYSAGIDGKGKNRGWAVTAAVLF
ncbi:hypothetical protein Barb6_01330 [Bacteroidales bacterium Barb6]|nr:hypothetical protein Barb6_01330 [Bacteroidales bacterium Barb6]